MEAFRIGYRLRDYSQNPLYLLSQILPFAFTISDTTAYEGILFSTQDVAWRDDAYWNLLFC